MTMRLKSKRQSTNQRLTTHVAIIWVICLLTKATTSMGYVAHLWGETQQRVARQLSDQGVKHSDPGGYHRPHFAAGRAVMVQLFEWKFVDIAEECRSFLGPQGYAGVQLSPVLEHTVIKTDSLSHPWWQRYETISYRLASRSGDETDFWSMSRICNDHGVRIYVDVVLNHMAAPLHLLVNGSQQDSIVDTLLASNVNISNLNYAEVPYAAQDFHRKCEIGKSVASSDSHEMRNCQLNGHPDLDHSRAAVRLSIAKMLNKFIDMGVAGFRIDTAKHIWPIDLKLIYAQLKDLDKEFNFEDKARPFMYHDVFDIGLDLISKTEYSTYGVVSEYLYAAELATILNGKVPLSSLINWGPAMGFLPHEDALIFIDSHDTQRGLPRDLGTNHLITHKQRQKYIMANALMLSHPYGRIKRVMSSYYFPEKDIDQGPPAGENDTDTIGSPQFNEEGLCTYYSGWVCEHRWPPLVRLMKLANYFSVPGQEEQSVIHFQTDGPNHIAFCRGQKAFVAMNNDEERDFVKEVYTCLEEGVYCDVISGGLKEDGQECEGLRLEVNAKGYAQLKLPVGEEPQNLDDFTGETNFGVLVVYVGSKVGLKQEDVDQPLANGEDSKSQDKATEEGEVEEGKGENAQEGDEQEVEASKDVKSPSDAEETTEQQASTDDKSTVAENEADFETGSDEADEGTLNKDQANVDDTGTSDAEGETQNVEENKEEPAADEQEEEEVLGEDKGEKAENWKTDEESEEENTALAEDNNTDESLVVEELGKTDEGAEDPEVKDETEVVEEKEGTEDVENPIDTELPKESEAATESEVEKGAGGEEGLEGNEELSGADVVEETENLVPELSKDAEEVEQPSVNKDNDQGSAAVEELEVNKQTKEDKGTETVEEQEKDKEMEKADDTEVAKVSKVGEEIEVAGESEEAEELEAAEESEAVGVGEENEGPDAAEKAEVAENSKAVEVAEKSEAAEEPVVAGVGEEHKVPDAAEGTENVEDTTELEATEQFVVPKEDNGPNGVKVEDPEVAEEAKVSEELDLEQAENPEIVKDKDAANNDNGETGASETPQENEKEIQLNENKTELEAKETPAEKIDKRQAADNEETLHNTEEQIERSAAEAASSANSIKQNSQQATFVENNNNIVVNLPSPPSSNATQMEADKVIKAEVPGIFPIAKQRQGNG
uniref:alpha-amylase n=1 Tax=Stomoxys calcitrans TaxID=35570 RepID=A0A1I8PLT6_STOCA